VFHDYWMSEKASEQRFSIVATAVTCRYFNFPCSHHIFSSITNSILKNTVILDVAPCNLVSTDVSEEHRLIQDLHGATSQKTTFFIVTAVKTSNLTSFILKTLSQSCGNLSS
jgi:hypothetical protein